MELINISQTLIFMFISFAASAAIVCFAVEDAAHDEALAEAIRRLRIVEVQQ